ncbi:MAG TPA: hypothetical protein VFC19_14835 [Candidatus Limnocylindrales bacterium]|nr:hypothetical protein [Candidatus Limnocylindrales bacterium]
MGYVRPDGPTGSAITFTNGATTLHGSVIRRHLTVASSGKNISGYAWGQPAEHPARAARMRLATTALGGVLLAPFALRLGPLRP